MSPLTPEQEDARRGSRPVELPISIPTAGALSLRISELVREDENLSEDQKMDLYRSMPRNRAEARRLMRGNGPWGLARRRS